MALENTNVPGFKKDKATGMVINTNTSELSAVKKQKQAILDKKKLEEKVNTMEKEMAEQKAMMQQVLYEFGFLKAGSDK